MARFRSTLLFHDVSFKALWECGDNGGVEKDSGPNGFDLTKHGVVVDNTTGGKFGHGADFGSGTTGSGYMETTNVLGSTAASDFSLGGWVKMDHEIDVNTGDPVLFEKSNSDGHVFNIIQYQYNGGARRLRYYRDRGGGKGSVDAHWPVNLGTTWHHIAMVFKSNGWFSYLDGVQVQGSGFTNLNGDSGYANSIGFGAETQGGNNLCPAIFDDVFFMDRGLTDSEVANLASDTGTTTSTSTSSTTTSTSTTTTSTSSSTSSTTTSTSTSTSSSTSSTTTSTTRTITSTSTTTTSTSTTSTSSSSTTTSTSTSTTTSTSTSTTVTLPYHFEVLHGDA